MANPQLAIRVAANLDELKKNIAEGKNQIEALGPSVAKLAATWQANSQRIIQDANNITAAVQQIGVKALSSGDSASALKKIELAMAQLRSASQPIPGDMEKIAAELKKTSGAGDMMSSWLGKTGPLLASFGVGLSVAALVGFGKELMADADLLVKLHDKTGISIEGLQRMRIAGDDAGVSLDAMTSAVNMLQKRLGGDDASAIEALKDLNINVEAFKSLDGSAQMSLLADRVAGIHDPLRVADDLSKLFGKSWAEMLPALKRGFQEVKDGVGGMSSGSVDALDRAGDAIAKFWRATKANIGEAVADILTLSTSEWRSLTSEVENATKAVEKMAPPINKVMPHQVVVDVKEFDHAMEASTKTMNDAATKLKAHNDALDAVNKKIQEATRDTGTLNAAQQASVLQYTALGLSNSEIGLKMGISELAVKKFNDQLKDHEEALKGAAEITKLFTAEGNKHWKEWADEVAKQLKTTNGLVVTNFNDHLAAQKVFDDEIAKRTMTSYDYQKFKINEHLQSQKEALATKGGDWKAAFDIDTKVANDAIEAIEWQKIQDDIDAADQATADWAAHSEANLSALSTAFSNLANIAGGALGGLMGALGQTIALMETMQKGGGALNQMFGGGTSIFAPGHTFGQPTSTGGQAAFAGAQVGVGMLADATEDPETKKGQVAHYAAKGAQMGAIAGPYGMAIGAGVGAIVGALKVSPVEIAARKEYEEWQARIIAQFDQMATKSQTMEAAGRNWAKVNITVRDAYESVGLTGDQAMKDLSIALDATHHNADDVKAALARINQTLDYQKQDAADLDAAVQKYGFSIEELGPKMRQQKLTEQGVSILNNFRLLAGSGIEVSTVLQHMGGDINEFIHSALKTGTEVPEAMRPMLQKMVEMGTLTDADGNKITDLSTSGLSFSETMTKGFDRIVAALEKISMGLGVDVPTAASTAASSLTTMTEATRRNMDLAGNKIADLNRTIGSMPNPFEDWHIPDQNIDLSPSDVVPMAGGGDFIVQRPTLFLAGEAGPERATFSGANNIAGGRGNMSTAALEQELRQLRRELPRRLAVAVTDALQLRRPG